MNCSYAQCLFSFACFAKITVLQETSGFINVATLLALAAKMLISYHLMATFNQAKDLANA